jgi:hypothetical protein
LHAQIKFYGISKFTEQTKSSEHFLKKKYRAGQIRSERAETARIRPRSVRGARETPIQMAGKRGSPVSASGRPNRYAPISAIRSSDDRRRSFVISTTETRASAGVRVWSGVHWSSPRAARRRSGSGIQLRCVGKRSAMSSERRTSKRRGPRPPPSPPDAPARLAMTSATVGLSPGKV